MANRSDFAKLNRPTRVAIMVFTLACLISAAIIWNMERNRVDNERARLYALASDHAIAAQNHLDRALSAVYALAALVQQSHGRIQNFDAVATKMLPYYPGVSILILAPDGVISNAIPIAGNEKAIGLNLLQDPVMQKETQLARNTGMLTLAGPLELRQGGLGLVARLPIFLDQPSGTATFWGFTNVVLRFPQALASAQLPSLARRGLDYKLWRVNPENGQVQIIDESATPPLNDAVRKSFSVPNGAWTLSLAPHAGWGDPKGLSLKIMAALVLSLLLAYLAKLQMRQRAYKTSLERQVAERTADIRASKLQLAATLEAIPDLLFEMDLEGRYLTCHVPRTNLLVAPVESLLGKTVDEVLPPAAAKTVLKALHEAHANEISNGQQIELPVPAGMGWFELSVARKPVAPGQPLRFIVISHDITARKEAEARVQQLAYYDALTGLPNRSLLNDRISHTLNEAARHGEAACVMFLDLDHFKNINDTLGHGVGDALLVTLSLRMRAVVREQDTVARLGGDEFILLLPETSAEGAARVAQKLLQAISQPLQIDTYELTITPSIGIAVYPDDGTDPETLSKHADVAMYRAKHGGRNNYQFFTHEMQIYSARTLLLDNELRRALERQQLHLHYQPQLSLHTGRVIGVEALLRWQHPELGAISPVEFIPIAENSGQILPIGEWVLRTAASQARQWHEAGFEELTMAVNLSAVQFRQPGLAQTVTDILAQAQLEPRYLEIELTESVAQQDPLGAIAIMAQLHQQGVRIAIDDFGTGYSSLAYLKRFQAYQLKIDQSFVRDITDDPDDLAIVRAIISMAHSLGLTTIAEGVETHAQLALLRDEGCDEVQGYLFSKPLPALELAAFLRAQA